MTRTRKQRPSYREAVAWIALNDNAGGGDSPEWIAGYVTTGLVADLFGCPQEEVAADVARVRRREGLGVGEDGEGGA